eukprot:1194601-Prorocentrum_minimum.AAC.4
MQKHLLCHLRDQRPCYFEPSNCRFVRRTSYANSASTFEYPVRILKRLLACSFGSALDKTTGSSDGRMPWICG